VYIIMYIINTLLLIRELPKDTLYRKYSKSHHHSDEKMVIDLGQILPIH